MTALFALLGTLSGGNCGVTSSRSRSFDVSSLIGLSPSNDSGRAQRSGSCSPPTPAAVVVPGSIPGSRMAPLTSHPSPNVSVGPPAPPPPTGAAGAAAQAAANAAAFAAAVAAGAGGAGGGAAAGAGSGGGAPPVAPSGLYPFLLHPGLYQHLITGKHRPSKLILILFFAKPVFLSLNAGIYVSFLK